jgi:hypothetical protein
MVARIDQQKDYLTLAKAAQRVVGTEPRVNWTFTFEFEFLTLDKIRLKASEEWQNWDRQICFEFFEFMEKFRC